MTTSELEAQDKISVADGWTIATFIARNATLVPKDPAFGTAADCAARKTLLQKRMK